MQKKAPRSPDRNATDRIPDSCLSATTWEIGVWMWNQGAGEPRGAGRAFFRVQLRQREASAAQTQPTWWTDRQTGGHSADLQSRCCVLWPSVPHCTTPIQEDREGHIADPKECGGTGNAQRGRRRNQLACRVVGTKSVVPSSCLAEHAACSYSVGLSGTSPPVAASSFSSFSLMGGGMIRGAAGTVRSKVQPRSSAWSVRDRFTISGAQTATVQPS